LDLSFQSSPGLVTGRYLKDLIQTNLVQLFQSSPGLVTGRYVGFVGIGYPLGGVSILARSGDRALPSCAASNLRFLLFQSSPGLVTGRYPWKPTNAASIARFNPRPVW